MSLVPLMAALALSGCTAVAQQRWTRIDGAPCMTTHVAPVFWSAETETDCMEHGRAVTLETNHDDLSMLAGLGALVGIVSVTP